MTIIGLRATAHNDLGDIMKDPAGFVWSCTITSPAGVSLPFSCRSNDIELSIDPGTGETVTGRQATVAVYIADLITVDFDGIRGIEDTSQKPWIVDVDDINGVAGKFKVVQTFPDRGAGLNVLGLELYNG